MLAAAAAAVQSVQFISKEQLRYWKNIIHT